MAKTVIDNLAVLLGADTRKFSKKMKAATKPVRGFAASVFKASKRVALFGPAIAAAVTGGGLVLMTKRALESADALGKTSAKLGIATEDLASLRHAAELSGVATNTLDLALQRMTRRVAEAAQGTGEAKNALKELGLEAAVLSRAGPAQAMSMIADALLNVETSADRVRLAFKLFDSEGVGVINTLAKGSAGLNEAAEDARRLGIAINGVDVAQIEAANDAIQRLQTMLRGVGLQLAVELSPFIEEVSNRLVAMGTDGGGAAVVVIESFERVTLAIARAVAMMEQLRVSVLSWRSITVRAAAEVAGVLSKNLLEQINRVADEMQRLEHEMSGINDNIEQDVILWFRDLRDGAEKAAQSVAATRNQMKTLGTEGADTFKKINEEQRKAARLAGDFGNAMGTAINSTITDVKRLDEALLQLARDIQRALIQQLITQPIVAGLTSFFTGALGSSGTPTSGGLGLGPGAPPPGVTSGGGVLGGFARPIAFARGGVVNSPQIFPMAGGLGLRGEAGAEAVMPIKRTASGDLGVAASGFGGGQVNVKVVVINNSGEPVKTQQQDDGRGGLRLAIIIGEQMAKDVRTGGPLGRAISEVNGLRRAGVTR